MTSILLQSDMRLGLAASPPSTPVQSQRWELRSLFNTKSSGTISTQGGPTASPLTNEAQPPYSSHELAATLQAQVDEENRLLLAEGAQLEAAPQRVLDCGVCMDTLPEESIARIESCGHPFCRDCVRGHVKSQMESRRFPVLCPTCTAEPGNYPESIGNVTRELVLDIGIADEQYDTWVEMETSKFLIRLQCTRCTQTSFFLKMEFEETRNFKCPSVGCNGVWCKDCQQEITPDGPEHSCDGSLELERLIREKGWKYCPTCGTPCEKISGCNDVPCITPGCYTRFCYGCGGLRSRPVVVGAIAGIAGGNTKHCRC